MGVGVRWRGVGLGGPSRGGGERPNRRPRLSRQRPLHLLISSARASLPRVPLRPRALFSARVTLPRVSPRPRAPSPTPRPLLSSSASFPACPGPAPPPQLERPSPGPLFDPAPPPQLERPRPASRSRCGRGGARPLPALSPAPPPLKGGSRARPSWNRGGGGRSRDAPLPTLPTCPPGALMPPSRGVLTATGRPETAFARTIPSLGHVGRGPKAFYAPLGAPGGGLTCSNSGLKKLG